MMGWCVASSRGNGVGGHSPTGRGANGVGCSFFCCLSWLVWGRSNGGHGPPNKVALLGAVLGKVVIVVFVQYYGDYEL